MKLTPTPIQEENIDAVLNCEAHGALIASATGFGKTLVTSEIILRAGWRRVLIIGVRDTAKQWAERIAEQSDRLQSVRIINATKTGEANLVEFLRGADGIYFAGLEFLRSRDWLVRDKLDADGNPIPELDKNTGRPTGKNEKESVRLDTFGKVTKKKPLDAVIIDEIHKIANPKAHGFRTAQSIKSEWRIGLSATWMGNTFAGAWAPAKWVFPNHVDGARMRWQRDFCVTEMQRVGGGKEVEQIKGERVPGAFAATLPLYLRLEPEPEPPVRVFAVPMTPEQKMQYQSLEKQSLAWLKTKKPDMDHEPLVADLPIVERARLRTAALAEMSFDEDGEVTFAADAKSNKLGALKHIIDNVWPDMPIVIYTHSKKYAKVTHARLIAAGYGAQLWTGDQTKRERDAIKAKFIAEDPSARYLVAVIDALREGVDGLQTVCSRIVWLSKSDSAINCEQALGRVWRQGMTRKYGDFQHIEIQSAESIDVKVSVQLTATQKAARASMRILEAA